MVAFDLKRKFLILLELIFQFIDVTCFSGIERKMAKNSIQQFIIHLKNLMKLSRYRNERMENKIDEETKRKNKVKCLPISYFCVFFFLVQPIYFDFFLLSDMKIIIQPKKKINFSLILLPNEKCWSCE